MAEEKNVDTKEEEKTSSETTTTTEEKKVVKKKMRPVKVKRVKHKTEVGAEREEEKEVKAQRPKKKVVKKRVGAEEKEVKAEKPTKMVKKKKVEVEKEKEPKKEGEAEKPKKAKKPKVKAEREVKEERKVEEKKEKMEEPKEEEEKAEGEEEEAEEEVEEEVEEEEEEIEIIEEEEEYRVKIKPELSDELIQKLKIRRDIKKKTPDFKRQEWFRYKRIGTAWRRPRGLHSKMRKHKGYRQNVVSIGYSSPKGTRNLHPSGFEEVMVYNANDLDKIDPKSQAARVGHSVGTRKRIEIEEKAEEKGIRVLNPRRL